MPSAIPTGQMTRLQIRDLALNRAGNRALATDAISWLAEILFDLATLWDWPFLMVTTTVTITGPTFDLPSGADGAFYQTQDDAGLKPLTWDGQTVGGATPILEVDRQTFDVGHDPNGFGQPIFWTVDRSGGVGYVSPNPTGHTLTAQLRYKRVPFAVAAADEAADVPWFPWHNYLVQAVYCEALQHEKDPRVTEAVALREQMFDRIRRGSSPRMAQHATIPLDPTVFRASFRGD